MDVEQEIRDTVVEKLESLRENENDMKKRILLQMAIDKVKDE